MTYEILIPLLAAAVQSGTPLLYATLGEIFSEKSGMLNLGVEGAMIMGAFSGFAVALTTHNLALAVVVSGLVGSLTAALYGIVCILFQGNQVVAGLALTTLGTGLANYLGAPLIGQVAPGFSPVALPFLSDIPALGKIFFTQDILVYISYCIAPLMYLFFTRTRYGLALRSAGEYPAAATAAGLNVFAYRWMGILVSGFFMGLGGAYLSLAYTHFWTSGMTAGRGWIAVALVIFAFWRPGRAVFGAYLFGGIMALQLRLQASGTTIPSSLLMMLPYLLTIVVLVFASWHKGSTDEPGALGVNIEPMS